MLPTTIEMGPSAAGEYSHAAGSPQACGIRESVCQLLAHHAALLRISAISPAVSAARGYRSVSTKAELTRLGFSDVQRRVPALLIPVRNVHGDLVTYQLRPDEPRVRDGRIIKYEIPAGASMVLDVPSPIRTQLLSLV